MSAPCIVGWGAVTPVGLSAAASSAALRGGISRIGPIASSEVTGPRGEPEPVSGGRVPLEWLHGGPVREEWPGHERAGQDAPLPIAWFIADGLDRLVDLARPALEEAWAAGGAQGRPGGDCGLFLACDEDDDGKALAARLVRELAWAPALVEAVPRGRAAVIAALALAAAAIAKGGISRALVCGVGSRIRPAAIAAAQAAGTLRDEDHPQGIIPGECAAALLLAGGGPGPRLAACAIADEPTVASGKPNQAKALGEVLRQVVEAAKPPCQPLVVCDLNGDRYRALEWGLANVRALGHLAEGPGIVHAAEAIGDAGAGLGALALVQAADAVLRGAPQALVWGASASALRGAAILVKGA